MISTTITIATANIQRINDCSKRQSLLTHWSKATKVSILLLTEMHLPSDKIVKDWQEATGMVGFDGIFVLGSRTAIIWRVDDQHITLPPFQYNQLLTSSPFLQSRQRTTDCQITIGSQVMTIIAVYVPVEAGARPGFLQQLHDTIANQFPNSAVTIGGDWNVVEDPRIDSTNPIGVNVGESQMRALTHAIGLVDTYRMINPKKLDFTNTSSGANRRLDRIYMTQDISTGTTSVDKWAATYSTHNPYVVRYAVPGAQQTGPGFFKLGLHIIQRPGMDRVLTEMVAECHAQAIDIHPTDLFEAWDHTKQLLSKRLQSLTRRLAQLDRAAEGDPSYRKFLSQAHRARLRPEETGEYSVKLRLKQIRAQSLVPGFQDNGTLLTDPSDMLEHATKHFQKIFCQKDTDIVAQQALIQYLGAAITAEDAASFELPYELEEMQHAAKKIRRGAAPGDDGLPNEFYLATWSVTGPILLQLKNQLHARKGLLSHSQRSAIMPLAWKRNEKDRIGNYRPLCNPNSDSKIMDKTDTIRMNSIIHKIIGPNQTGFIPQRWIGTNIAEVQRRIEEEDQHPGMIAVTDFENAYDYPDHAWIELCLKKLGFGPRMISNIRSSFIKRQGSIYLNGWVGAPFEIHSGVGQGKPQSPDLYAILLEPLLCMIRKLVRGIPLPINRFFREVAFADDVESGLADEEDLKTLTTCCKTFERATGSKLALHKSFVYPLGSFQRSIQGPTIQEWPVQRKDFKLLGVMVGRNVDKRTIWQDMLQKIRRRLNSIPMFDLPIHTRCHIVNTRIYSKIFYLDQFLPCPVDLVEEIERIAVNAMWKRGRHEVALERLTTPLLQGGFSLLPLKRQLWGARAMWIYWLLCDEDKAQLPHLLTIRVRLATSLAVTGRTSQKAPGFYWNWRALFCLPTDQVWVDWANARAAMKALLSTIWIDYLDAWERVVYLPKKINWQETFLSKTRELQPQYGIHVMLDPNLFLQKGGKPVAFYQDISNQRRQHQLFQPTIVPKGWQKRLHLPQDRWSLYWTNLALLNSIMPEEVDTAHRIALGSLQPHSLKSTFATHTQTGTDDICALCADLVREDWHHLFCECPVSKAIWSQAWPPAQWPEPPDLGQFICATAQPINLAFLIAFQHHIQKLAIFQRYSRMAEQALSSQQVITTAFQIYLSARAATGRIKAKMAAAAAKRKKKPRVNRPNT